MGLKNGGARDEGFISLRAVYLYTRVIYEANVGSTKGVLGTRPKHAAQRRLMRPALFNWSVRTRNPTLYHMRYRVGSFEPVSLGIISSVVSGGLTTDRFLGPFNSDSGRTHIADHL